MASFKKRTARSPESAEAAKQHAAKVAKQEAKLKAARAAAQKAVDAELAELTAARAAQAAEHEAAKRYAKVGGTVVETVTPGEYLATCGERLADLGRALIGRE